MEALEQLKLWNGRLKGLWGMSLVPFPLQARHSCRVDAESETTDAILVRTHRNETGSDFGMVWDGISFETWDWERYSQGGHVSEEGRYLERG